MKDTRLTQLATGLFIQFTFIFVCAIAMLVLLVAERFMPRKKRPRAWRALIHYLSLFLIRIGRIKLDIQGPVPRHTFPVIYAANHPSMIDPFLFFALLGPNLIPLVAPTQSFRFPFNIYLKKMGAVDVIRDLSDDAEFHGKANTPREAIQKLNTLIEDGTNILVFPEGHIERVKELHYFHTGAARVSLHTKAPVVPITLVNMDRVILNTFHARPGTVAVHMHHFLHPPDVTTQLPFGKAVKEFRDAIEKRIEIGLPKRNFPAYRAARHPEHIGVFIDIDQTIYLGYSQQDFVAYLMKTRRIKKRAALHIFRLIVLEKLGLLAHEDLMKESLSMLRGKKVETLSACAERFFNKEFGGHLNDRILPLIKDHQEQGHTIVLVTEVIPPLAKQFQRYFKATTCFETTLRTKNGRYTGDVTRLCWREEKANAVKRFAKSYGIDLLKSYAYGDSKHDIPMLKLVGFPRAVNPDHVLKKEAMKRRWNII